MTPVNFKYCFTRRLSDLPIALALHLFSSTIDFMVPILHFSDEAKQPNRYGLRLSDKDSSGAKTLSAHTARTQSRPSKIGKINLPLEFDLLRMLSNVTASFQGYDCPIKSWNEYTPACEWEYFRCNSHGQVNSLEVRGNEKLRGTLQWAYMPQTFESFYIARHDLQGSIPLEHLSREMKDFDVSHNAFNGELDFPQLPITLEKLRLGGNMFEGTLDLTNLPIGLTELQANSNKFSGSVCLSTLPPQLRMLDLSENAFTGTPDLCSFPPCLRKVFLNDNDFDGCAQFDFLHEGLHVLQLYNNPNLCGRINMSFLPTKLSIFSIPHYDTNIQHGY